MTNSELHEKLELRVLLKGNEYDGMLNFGAVALHAADEVYILDCIESVATTELFEGNEVVSIAVKFDTFDNTLETFEGFGFDFSQNLADLLKSPNLVAKTNLWLDALPNAKTQVKENIERVVSIKLLNPYDIDIDIDVQQDFDM